MATIVRTQYASAKKDTKRRIKAPDSGKGEGKDCSKTASAAPSKFHPKKPYSQYVFTNGTSPRHSDLIKSISYIPEKGSRLNMECSK